MATTEEMQKAMANTEAPTSIKTLIESKTKELAMSLPDHMKPERLVRIALTCIRQIPDLAKCTPESFLGALFTAAQLGVEPVAGRAFLLPFNNSKKKGDGSWHTVKECQFVLGYKGIVDLFYRHEKAICIEWGAVKEGDIFGYEKGTKSYISHIPQNKSNKVLGYWVMANLVNGGKPFHYMTLEECLEHGKKHSKTYDKKKGVFYDSSPWVKDADSMCLKTVLLQLMKILPLSIELQKAINADETSREMRPGVNDMLEIPSTTDWEHEAKEEADKAFEGGK